MSLAVALGKPEKASAKALGGRQRTGAAGPVVNGLYGRFSLSLKALWQGAEAVDCFMDPAGP